MCLLQVYNKSPSLLYIHLSIQSILKVLICHTTLLDFHTKSHGSLHEGCCGCSPASCDRRGPGTSAASFGEGLSVKELQVQGDVCAR
uniref:Uncharacterized protein n=1 Tax=Triticum urartu TaxID=4572 RepID=A0A8R7PY97_TRIUA